MSSDSSHEQLLPYSPEWAERYEVEAARLREVFGDSLLGLEHIGSTSVPGLGAKPIIDIAALLPNELEAEHFVEPLAALGYPFDRSEHGKYGPPERHLFRKGAPTEYHLSLAYADKGSFWKRQLAFRDYLRAHPEDRDRYAALKRELIAKDPSGKDSYIADKTDFVNEVLDKAGFVRWKPPEA